MLDRLSGVLADAHGRRFDPLARSWQAPATPPFRPAQREAVDAISAATWLQRQSGVPVRVPVGVIGPRDASPEQLAIAEDVGRGLGTMGFAVICGGRQGVMHAVCKGVDDAGGLSIGLLPETDPGAANPYVGVVIATGIGEARNALIARAAFCLVVVGDSYGTLSEVALGRQFGKRVIGLAGAAQVAGVMHVPDVTRALDAVARYALGVD